MSSVAACCRPVLISWHGSFRSWLEMRFDAHACQARVSDKVFTGATLLPIATAASSYRYQHCLVSDGRTPSTRRLSCDSLMNNPQYVGPPPGSECRFLATDYDVSRSSRRWA